MYMNHRLITKVVVGPILLFTFSLTVLATGTEKLNEDQVHQKKFHHFVLL